MLLIFLSTPSARRATRASLEPHDALTRFLSTPSARRATVAVHRGNAVGVISIHALREEGDITASFSRISKIYFYPRPPRGGRRAGSVRGMAVNLFLSTPSARRATSTSYQRGMKDMISIHALREEGDRATRQRCP